MMEGKVQNSYSSSAANYDETRGMSNLLPLIVRGSVLKNFNELSVIDIGAGTGEAAKMLLNEGIGQVTVMDPSQNMLNIAKKKMRKEMDHNRAFTKLGGLPNMDFEDCSFDGALIIGSIHFADTRTRSADFKFTLPPLDETTNLYPGTVKALQEVYRVLKPGGVLVVGSMTPHQRRYSVWYSEYLPEDLAYGWPRHVTKDQMDYMILKAGFTDLKHLVDLNHPFIKAEIFDNPLKIEDEKWRVSDTGFLLLSEKEREEMLTRVREDYKSGGLDEVIERTKENLENIGDTTFFIASKK